MLCNKLKFTTEIYTNSALENNLSKVPKRIKVAKLNFQQQYLKYTSMWDWRQATRSSKS